MISPEGFAIKPRIAASCFIWSAIPRAGMRHHVMELIGLSRPFSSF